MSAGNWLGNRATIAICQTLTAVGIAVVLLLPLQLTLVMLPFLGLVLNGVTTVIYGSVPNYAAPERRTHLLSVFYTISIGAPRFCRRSLDFSATSSASPAPSPSCPR